MNQEKQRIAIAEACGWTNIRIVSDGTNPNIHPSSRPKHLRGTPPPPKTYAYQITPPDYLNDLNAMNEAEMTIDSYKRMDFRDYLVDMIQNDGFTEDDAHGECVHATAAQRAEAFLRTIGKWEDA